MTTLYTEEAVMDTCKSCYTLARNDCFLSIFLAVLMALVAYYLLGRIVNNRVRK